jgi:hypothetical protein
MRETCTSGSVRDGDGNVPIYSALDAPQPGQAGAEGDRVGQASKIVEEAELAGFEGIPQALQEQPPEQSRQDPHR